MNFYQVGAPAAQTDQAPAVVVTDFEGGVPDSKVFVAWKKAFSNTIWLSSSTDNILWSTPSQIKGSGWEALTDQGPALVLSEAFSGSDTLLYAAWKGDAGNKIWYSTSKDGVTWSDQKTVPGAYTNYKPSLGQNTTAGTGGPLAVAWLALDGSVDYTLSPSPIWPTWSGPSVLTSTGISKLAPALGSTSIGELVFSWVDNENTLWYQLLPNPDPAARVAGSGFTSKSDAAPSIPTQANNFGLACKGNGDDSVWVVKQFPSPPFTQQKVPGASTGYGPAWAGVGFILAFSAKGLVVNGSAVPDYTIWTCTP